MEDIQHLVIKVSSDQVETAGKRLDDMGTASQRAEKNLGFLASASGKAMAAFAALAAVAAIAYKGIGKVVEVTKEFETIEGRLRTVTASATEAKEVFDAIEQLSVDLPTSLEDTTNAFLRLAQAGLDPSRKALEAYANIAVATGSTLESVADAVATASNGQFRALQQFGIKAIQEVDGLTVVFKGNAEKIKGDAASIQEYMQRIGNVDFAGAAAAQAGTMADVIDDMEAAWFRLWKSISETGIGDLIKQGIVGATSAIQELTNWISSGQLLGYIEAIGISFRGWSDAAKTATAFVSETLTNAFGSWADEGNAAVGFLVDAFLHLPENVVAVVKGVGATLGLLWEYAKSVAKSIGTYFVAEFKYAWEMAQIVAAQIKAKITGEYDKFDWDRSYTEALRRRNEVVAGSFTDLSKEIGNATSAWQGVVTEIMDERDATITAAKDKIAAADAQRAAYDKLAASRRASNVDPLSGKGKPRGNDTASEEQRRQYEQLRLSLLNEENAVEESYQKRRALIINNTEKDSATQSALLQELEERKAVEMDAAHEATAERLQRQYEAQQNLLQAALDNKEISEKEFFERSSKNWNKYISGVGQISTTGMRTVAIKQMETQAQVLDMAAGIADQMSNLVQGNNDAAKTMFIVSKAIAIAQAIVNTELAATKALAEGGAYAGIPLSTIIRATGYASVALMAATAVQEYGGKFADGGIVPGTSTVGDNVAVNVNSKEMILNQSQQRQLWETANGRTSGSGSGTTVIINNFTSDEVTAVEKEDDTGKMIEITVRKVKNELTSEINTGGSTFARTLEQRYNLKRSA